MELKTKGSSAKLSSESSFDVSLCWTDFADYDLSVYYRAQDGSSGIIYFGGHQNTNGRENSSNTKLGSLEAFPFIKLAGDDNLGDWDGDNEEQLEIAHLKEMSEVYLLCWDYGAIDSGENAPFTEGNISIRIKDNSNQEIKISLPPDAIGNIAAIAKIEITEQDILVQNLARAGTIKNLNFEEIGSLCC